MQDWMKQWQAMSQQFAGAMNDLGRGNQAADAAAAWQNAAQPFANLFGAAPAPAEVLDRLSASAKGYFALLQSLASSAGTAGAGTDGGAAAWTEALRKGFNIPGLDPSLLDNPIAGAMRDLAGPGSAAPRGRSSRNGRGCSACPPSAMRANTRSVGRRWHARWPNTRNTPTATTR
jgi:hypothetical protein